MNKTEKSKTTYSHNASWNVIYENGLLVLNAGADKIFAIEDVGEFVGAEIVGLCHSLSINTDVLSSEAKEIFEQLKTAQIVRIDMEPKTKHKISLKYIGDENKSLCTQIEAQLGENFELTSKLDHDFLVIIRTNGTLQDVIAGDYASIKLPHLFLDIAFEHSISLGPLVFPGETACLSCLVGRLTTYWGDAEPPTRAAIQDNLAVVAGLMVMEVRKILNQYSRELVNNTVAYDFENYRVKKNSIYKLPMCPVCSISSMDNPGAIKLPWIQQK